MIRVIVTQEHDWKDKVDLREKRESGEFHCHKETSCPMLMQLLQTAHS